MTMRLSEGWGTWYPANTTLGSRWSCLLMDEWMVAAEKRGWKSEKKRVCA